MKSRIVRVGVLIASVMGLLATATPAEASYVKNVTLTGNAALFNCKDATTGAPSPGLSYPVWTSGGATTTEIPDTKTEYKPGPKGTGIEVNTIVLNGNLCDFFFGANCVKVSVGNKKTGVDTCTITATGTVTGFCGLSSGLGTAVLVNTSNTLTQKPDVVTDFKFSSTVTTLRVSDKDGDPTDWIQGQVSVNPNVQITGGGSCTNKTATTFLIAGDVVIKQCNGSTPAC